MKMFSLKSMKKEALLAILTLALTGGIACADASAMARAPGGTGTGTGTGTGSIIPGTPAPVVIDPSGDDFARGFALGQRNGTILVDRLRQRTVDVAGCSAVDELQRALITVTRTVRPPVNSADGLVSGFYSGYLDAVRDELRTVRRTCDDLAYQSGEFPGQLYGTVVCQVTTVDVNAVSGLQLEPLYSGWSGGATSVQESCRTTLSATVEQCGGATVSSDLEATLRVICSDSTL